MVTMQALIQKLALLASQADETDAQRADRLTDAAEQAGVDPTTLYEVERDLRALGRQYAAENEEHVEQVAARFKTLAPMLGMDPATAEDQLSEETVIKLGTMFATGRPDATAAVVKALHEAFERRGLYEEMDVETPAPGELEPTIDVEGVAEAVEGGE